MSKPQKRIVLAEHQVQTETGRHTSRREFTVKKIVNSIEFKIGQVLLENDVSNLCVKTYWTVEVIAP